MKAAIIILMLAIYNKDYIKRLIHKQRKKRMERQKQRLQREYKRRFNEGLKAIDDWRRETDTKRQWRQNIICKNPAIAAVWK